MPVDLVLWIIAIAVLAAHWFVSGSRLHQLGVVLPLAWTAAVVAFAVTGHMGSWRDWVMAVLGLLVLLVIWERRRTERKSARSSRGGAGSVPVGGQQDGGQA